MKKMNRREFLTLTGAALWRSSPLPAQRCGALAGRLRRRVRRPRRPRYAQGR